MLFETQQKSIEEVIAQMHKDGRSDEEIQAVINAHNKKKDEQKVDNNNKGGKNISFDRLTTDDTGWFGDKEKGMIEKLESTYADEGFVFEKRDMTGSDDDVIVTGIKPGTTFKFGGSYRRDPKKAYDAWLDFVKEQRAWRLENQDVDITEGQLTLADQEKITNRPKPTSQELDQITTAGDVQQDINQKEEELSKEVGPTAKKAELKKEINDLKDDRDDAEFKSDIIEDRELATKYRDLVEKTATEYTQFLKQNYPDLSEDEIKKQVARRVDSAVKSNFNPVERKRVEDFIGPESLRFI